MDNDIEFNISQMEKALQKAEGKVDLLCFGESFLQGFEALSWNFETDRHVAITINSATMQGLCQLSLQYNTDFLFGYIEREGETLYSSCAVIAKGKLLHNYRRISKGWKEFSITDHHYKEGDDTAEFIYRGRPIKLAICGDLWDFPERFKTETLLIWPVYVSFTLDEWVKEEAEYAAQAFLATDHVLMINSLSDEPAVSHGGSFYFAEGKLKEKLPYDTEGILIIEV
jgi:N-carbamoylputrescine amidase